MPANRAAENALGTMGTICWTIQLVPQIYKNWRAKSTEGLSEWLVLLWGVSGAPMGIYAIVQNLNIPLILQPQLFGILCFASWIQVSETSSLVVLSPDFLSRYNPCLYYGRRLSLTTCIVLYIICLVSLAGFQVGMVYAVRPSYEKGNERGVEFFGIFSSVIIALALLPQYYDIYRRREVVGISIPFMIIDMLGGVFNDLSLAFKSQFDVIAGVTYSLVVVMDGIVILLALILNPLARRRRKRAALAAAEDEAAAAEQETDVERASGARQHPALIVELTPAPKGQDTKEQDAVQMSEVAQIADLIQDSSHTWAGDGPNT